MKKSVLVRIIAAAMAIALCVCSVGALTGCTQTRKINVLVYGQYIDLDVISNFKKEHGIKVSVDECDTPEELYNKAVNGDQSYDLICTSDYIIERFIKENRLAELNFDNIPNIKNIGEVYLEKSKSFDPENKYSVPHFWGTVGVIYNTKMVSEEDAKSWKMFFNEKYSGKIVMSNSIRDSFLVALEALDYSLNTTDKAQIDEAKQLLIKQKPMLKAYLVETEARDAMISGEAAMALVYNGEAYLAIEGDEEQNISGNPDLKFTIPEEGTNFWIDSWVVPVYSSNKADAEAFINYLCGVDAAKKNFEYIYYSTPNQALFDALAPEVQQDEDIFPSREVIDKGEVYHDLGAELDAYYSAAWKEIKS